MKKAKARHLYRLYRALGALPDLEEALYFSAITFTILSYGDVVLQSSWPLLASFEGVKGIGPPPLIGPV